LALEPPIGAISDRREQMLSKTEVLFRTKYAVAVWCKWSPKKPPLYLHRKLGDLRVGALDQLRERNDKVMEDQAKGFPIPGGIWNANAPKTVGDLYELNLSRLE
jgi:hypothetical protein